MSFYSVYLLCKLRKRQHKTMKILVTVHKGRAQRLLVALFDCSLIKDIKKLVTKAQYSRAIVLALSKGKILRQLTGQYVPGTTDVDLILSETHAHFDVT